MDNTLHLDGTSLWGKRRRTHELKHGCTSRVSRAYRGAFVGEQVHAYVYTVHAYLSRQSILVSDTFTNTRYVIHMKYFHDLGADYCVQPQITSRRRGITAVSLLLTLASAFRVRGAPVSRGRNPQVSAS